jgi:hypothetical protein
MRTTEEITEMVKGLSPEECYDFISAIVSQNKVVLYGNWYSKKHIREKLESGYPEYIRDRKLKEVLENHTPFDFDTFYEVLAENTADASGGPSEDFNEYIFNDFMYDELEGDYEE